VWSDDVAARALAVLHDALGLHAPSDIYVIGFDGVESVCGNCWPRPTSVRQPIHEIVHWAVETLVRLIHSADAFADSTHRLRFPTDLLAGATYAPTTPLSLKGEK
jgi:DNA-binding LacI/PurR family transcriptional regulator